MYSRYVIIVIRKQISCDGNHHMCTNTRSLISYTRIRTASISRIRCRIRIRTRCVYGNNDNRSNRNDNLQW